METFKEYLERILETQTINEDDSEYDSLVETYNEIKSLILEEYPTAETEVDIVPSGSFVKKTMVIVSYDLDILVVQKYDSDVLGDTIKEIYENLAMTLENNGWIVERKRSSLQLFKQGENDIKQYTHVDVVPGRYIDDSETDLYINQHESDKERQKTNLKKQIDNVIDSGLTELIKLMKIIKYQRSLVIKTFILELLIIELGMKSRDEPIDTQFISLLEEVRDNIDSVQIEDPANPIGNDLSDDFNDEIKDELKIVAETMLELIEQGHETEIYSPVFDNMLISAISANINVISLSNKDRNALIMESIAAIPENEGTKPWMDV